jgi:hypothetical protein
MPPVNSAQLHTGRRKITVTDFSAAHQREQKNTVEPSLGSRFGTWLQDPLGSIIAASVAAMGSLGVVLSGAWFIHLVLN